MKIVLLSLLLVGASAQAQQVEDRGHGGQVAAMAENIGFKCTSEDGKTSISGYVPGDMIESEITVEDDGFTFKFKQISTEWNKDIIEATTSVLDGVFAVGSRSLKESSVSKSLKLSAIPKTMVGYVKDWGFQVSFDARFLYFYDEKEANCNFGCIAIPVEVQTAQKKLSKAGVLKCLAAHRIY